MSGIDSKTTSLLHFDGNFVDTVGNHWRTPQAAYVSGDVKVFGDAAAVFSGTNFAKVDECGFDLTIGDFTVEFWIYMDVVSANIGPIELYTTTAGDQQGIVITNDQASGATFTARVGSGGAWAAAAPLGSITAKTWVNLALVRCDGQLHTFNNGKLVATVSLPATTRIDKASGVLKLGSHQWSSSGEHYLNGRVDELRISNTARYLTDYTVATAPFTVDANTLELFHFDQVSGLTGAKGLTLTSSTPGAVISADRSRFGATSLYLDRKSYLTTDFSENFNIATGDFTIDWWEYQVSGGSYPVSFAMDSATNEAGLVVGENVGGQRNCYASSTLTNGWDVLSGFSLGAVTNNVWTHFALVRRGSTFYGFRNGVLTNTTTSDKPIYLDATTRPIIGKRVNNGYDYWFLGYVDEFRFSKGVARWTSSFTPPVNPYTKIHYLARTTDGNYHAYANSAWVDLGQPTDPTALKQLFMSNAAIDPFDLNALKLLNGTVKQCAFQETVEQTPIETMTAVPQAQFVYETTDIDLKQVSYVDWVKANANTANFEAGAGKLRLLASRDSGVTWCAFDQTTAAWSTVIDTTNAVDCSLVNNRWTLTSAGLAKALASGMTTSTFNTVDWNAWTLGDGFKQMRFAYVLSIDKVTDAAASDTLTYQYDGVGNWMIASANMHYEVRTKNNAHSVKWLSPINGKRVKVNY